MTIESILNIKCKSIHGAFWDLKTFSAYTTMLYSLSYWGINSSCKATLYSQLSFSYRQAKNLEIFHAHGIIIIPRNELYRFKRYRVRIIYRRCWLKKLKKNIPSLDSMLAWVAGIWSLSRLSLRDSREAIMASEAAFWASYSVTVWSKPAAK